jgi:pyruvate dehydrogenase E1 component alpha subunit
MFSAEHNFLGGFAFIGEGIPVGAGAAFQARYKRDVLGDESADQVCASFFGDGTCNNGAFYETLNMASLYKLPCLFVVENNKWAIGMAHDRSTAPSMGDKEPCIYKKGPAFGMPGVLVDGMDVMAVRKVAEEAIARARRGDGPTLIECETYRYRGHSLADPDELRKQDEKDHYAKRDPIPKFREYMLKEKLATEAELKEWEKVVDDEVEEAVEFADASDRPSKDQLFENVFADPSGFGIAHDGGSQNPF